MRHHDLNFLLQRGRLMQTIAGVLLITFTWFLLYPTAIAAQMLDRNMRTVHLLDTRAEAEMAKTLEMIEAQLARFSAKLAQDEDTSFDAAALTKLHKRMGKLDKRVRQHFVRIEQYLKGKGWPDEIFQRHAAMVTTYKGELATLLSHLDALEAAKDTQARTAMCQQALKHLQAIQKRHAYRFIDPHNLPFRVPRGTVRQPRESTEAWHSSLLPSKPVMVAAAALAPGMLPVAQLATPSAVPTSDDLAETEDVQLTEELRALALALNHNPVKIYNWVHDSIAFLPTYGSIQGAQMTLANTKGNAFDTASLLIALLRASNIPARYVTGTVQLPIEKVMN